MIQQQRLCRRAQLSVAVLTLLLAVGRGAGAQSAPESVARVMAAHGIPADSVSMIVTALADDSTLVSVNPETARNPASSIKLLTTFVALDVLGPDYTWPTYVYRDGPIHDGVLDGDLVIKGFGDPYFVIEEFWRMLREVRALGVREIKGDLVIDDSHFAVPPGDPGAFDGQPNRLYNVRPSAMLVNFKSFEFQFRPDKDGRNVRIRAIPDLSNLRITNKLSQVNGRCSGYRKGIIMSVPDPVLADHVVFSGTFPAACHSYTLYRSVLQPHTYAYGAFKLLWAQWGGDIQGTVRLGKVPDSAQRLLTWQSRPLGESVRAVNKWSNNVMTRLLLYSIALAKYDAPVTREQGVEVIHEYLQANNLDDTGLVIDNGSGLSRDTRITGTLMSQLLRHAYHSRFMPEFIASMSIAGLDGTTRRRFKGKPEAGQMHLKTGRLDDVAAIAGYVVAASGKTYSVVLLANSQNIHNGPGIELQNTLLQWVYRQ